MPVNLVVEPPDVHVPEQFDGHVAAQEGVPGAAYLGHPAGAQQVSQPVPISEQALGHAGWVPAEQVT